MTPADLLDHPAGRTQWSRPHTLFSGGGVMRLPWRLSPGRLGVALLLAPTSRSPWRLSPWGLTLALLLALTTGATGLYIPLEVEQLPTITAQTSGPVIAFPADGTFTMRCEAQGNPPPEYRWTKDGRDFELSQDARIEMMDNNGSFVLQSKHLAHFRGRYRCYASNRLGTAISEEIQLVVVHSIPKFPKENIEPIVIEEGQPVTLRCNPPDGMPPRQIYWMSLGLQHIDQDERVSVDRDGNLYFSNALKKDSRPDYCCFAAFPAIRTIVQKTAMAVVVKNSSSVLDRKPSLLTPPGVQSEVSLVKGEELELECIAEGFPTPVVEWIKMGETLPKRTNIKNHGKLLTIPDVEDEDDGKYMCRATNSAGSAVHYFDVLVEEPPKWLPEPPRSQLAVIGSDVHIACSAIGKPQPVVVWMKNGQPLDDPPSARRRMFDDILVLPKAVPEDSAVYQCEASNRHGTILANANIMIMNMPPRMLTESYLEYAVVQGGDVRMDCRVFGSPPPTISWKNVVTGEAVGGDRFALSENGSLTVNRAQEDDGGEYVCVATNTEGASTVTASLGVKDPTRIVEPPQDVEVLAGTTALLSCQAESDPSLGGLEVVWRRDGEDVSGAPRLSVDDGTLQIVNVSQSDEGTYTCIARTRLDQDTANATVTVLDVSDAPEDLKLAEVKPRVVRLTWVPGDDHNSYVTEYMVEYEESHWEPGRWRELRSVPGDQAWALLELQGHLNYQFRVYATNGVGRGSPSKPSERYKTPPAAPDRNPESIRIQGHLPHQMDINWEPLLPVEHNGPGLEYKVSYRRLGLEDEWKEHLVKRHAFVVKNTPTFIPYEVKIQSRNSHGWGPEPNIVTGYSGEDVVLWHCLWVNVRVPKAAPRDVAVEMLNATLLSARWTPVPVADLRGHLGGYTVHWQRRRSLLHPDRPPEQRHSLSFPGNRSQAVVPGLKPFSEYRLHVNVFNKKGNGPHSEPVTFLTPEGVPEQVPILTASNAQKDSIKLVWGPPFEANGVLTGYLLQYQLMNETLAAGDLQEVNITGSDSAHWLLLGLQEASVYQFHLSACTRAGCGPPRTQEGGTLAQAPVSTTAAMDPTERIPVLLNVSSYVSDTFAKLSWTSRKEHQDSLLYVAYMNHREGSWRFSKAVNMSENFHMIDGLEPGTVYTVRLKAKTWLDNSSIFEDVIKTRVKDSVGLQGGISMDGWFIGLLCAVALLTVAVLIACFVRRNKGGKYAVKEKEDLHTDEASQGLNDDTFCEYSDEKPLAASRCSLDGGGVGGAGDDSADSLMDYDGDEEQFNEDGSFIGEYSGRHRRRDSVVAEPNGAVHT